MPLLDATQIRAALEGLPGWTHQGDAIEKTFGFDDFLGSVLFVNRVTGAAEAADHHPDVDIRWNRVRIHLSTHSQGGVTDRDVALAAIVDRLG